MGQRSSDRTSHHQPLRVIVVGAGVGGLGAALVLGRAGHHVTVLDRDDLTVASDPDRAFEIGRQGAPQVRHTHGLLARLTTLLKAHLPDVHRTLVEAGATEVRLSSRFAEPRPGDDDLHVLLARRTTLDWSLRRAAAGCATIELRGGASVDGLVGTSAGEGHPAVVRGVRLADGETLDADVVLSSGGRRAPLPAWLAPLGVAVPETTSDTGIVYLSRWYRTPDGWTDALDDEGLVRSAGDLGYLAYMAVPADRGAFSITMAIGAHDGELRSHLLEPEHFERAARMLPLRAGLLEPFTPTGPVHPMGGLINRIRRFTHPDGTPQVVGFHAVGDAHTCTNPLYGRGCALAMAQGVALAEALVAHPHDLDAAARSYDGFHRDQIEPWYHASVHTDEARKATLVAHHEARRRGEEPPTGADANPIAQLMRIGGDDPVVGRAILRVANVLTTPQELLADPAVMARAAELLAAAGDQAGTDTWARTGPARAELLAPAPV